MAPSHPGPEGAEAVLCPTAPQDGQEMTSSEKGTKRKRKVPHIPPSGEEGKAFLEGGYAGLPSTSAEFPGEFCFGDPGEGTAVALQSGEQVSQ